MPRRKDTAIEPKPTRAEYRKHLAQDLASILANPLTPVELYNFIADAHSDWETDKPWYEADDIERALLNYERKEAKRKGGRANG